MLGPDRRTIHAPARTPRKIPPQTPSPPFQTANGAHQALIALTSLQLVRSWYARAPTMPKPTPHTATRKTRSQSPPQRTHRQPVSATQPAIASSSISPYMWMVSGPTSTVPLCGDGIEASRVTRQRILPVAPETSSENDAKREIERAAEPEQVDRAVEVDVVSHGNLGRGRRRVAGALELLGAPRLDHGVLVEEGDSGGR